MAILQNWITGKEGGGFCSPSAISLRLGGNVYNHDQYDDDTFVYTDNIIDILKAEDHIVIKTHSGDYEIYPDFQDATHAKIFVDAYRVLAKRSRAKA